MFLLPCADIFPVLRCSLRVLKRILGVLKVGCGFPCVPTSISSSELEEDCKREM